MSGRTVTSSVEVAIDPAAAFTAFTEELGSWRLQGPINFHDSSRAYGLRMELGVGGRILEVYDDATGEGLELGRITAWEPGVRLSWTSSLDDVATEVTFRAAGRGTLVRVVATVPDGGLDAGGSSFVRVTPAWFARWTARRGRLPTAPEALSRLLVAVHCEHPGAAARWLQHAFGLELVFEIDDGGGDGGDGVWIELRAGSSAIVLLDAAHEGGHRGAVRTHRAVDLRRRPRRAPRARPRGRCRRRRTLATRRHCVRRARPRGERVDVRPGGTPHAGVGRPSTSRKIPPLGVRGARW